MFYFRNIFLRHRLRNALAGYYLTLMLIHKAQEQAGPQWQRLFVARDTALNVLCLGWRWLEYVLVITIWSLIGFSDVYRYFLAG